MILPRGMAQPAELEKEIAALAPYPPGVIKVRYAVEDDWSGDPAIYFRITLSDEAARREVRRQHTRRITDYIEERLDPIRRWDLFPYFNFRSESEQAELQDKLWN